MSNPPVPRLCVEQAADSGGIEVALPAKGRGGEHFACERFELSAQPGRGRDGEPALATVDDRVREERRRRAPQ